MARTFARLKGSIWTDDLDWRRLPAGPQRAYLLLISQPEINNCGVLAYTLRRWSGMASDTDPETLRSDLGKLADQDFIVFDEDTEELAVRSFVKHDEVLKQPNLEKAAKRQFDQIRSSRVRHALASQYPELFTLKPHEQAKTGGVPEDLPEGVSEGVGIRAQDSRESQELEPKPYTSNPTPAGTPPPAADAAEKLRTAGWRQAQIDAAAHDLERALKLLAEAEANPSIEKPGAIAWIRFQKPEARPEPKRADPAAVLECCGEKLGHGHADNCPRMPKAAA